VGLGGHALHGGYGPISRNWGLITDRILSIQVILADGSLVTTSDQENIDLFWALRGAGSSYGIATVCIHVNPRSICAYKRSMQSFTFRTYPAPKSNILFELKWPVVTPKIAAAVLMEYQAWLPTIPSELGIAYMLWPGEDKKHTMILEFSGK
jgi:FAD/FMN-containing dehydrogenase